jgi:hypothetical protein
MLSDLALSNGTTISPATGAPLASADDGCVFNALEEGLDAECVGDKGRNLDCSWLGANEAMFGWSEEVEYDSRSAGRGFVSSRQDRN